RAGVTDTPSSRKIPGSDKLFEFARLRNPYGRLTTTEDVAKCIAVLCHDNTYWMTGNTIGVDGGEDIVGGKHGAYTGPRKAASRLAHSPGLSRNREENPPSRPAPQDRRPPPAPLPRRYRDGARSSRRADGSRRLEGACPVESGHARRLSV